MRYLKPDHKIMINDQLYPLVYSLDVIDTLQSRVEMPMTEIISKLADESTMKITVQCLIKYLTGQIVNDNFEYYSILLLNTYIEQLKFKDEPEPQKSDREMHFEYTDIEYWFYLGKVVLRFSSDETWNMTIGQIRTLYEEHLKYNGWNKNTEVNIDDIVPY